MMKTVAMAALEGHTGERKLWRDDRHRRSVIPTAGRRRVNSTRPSSAGDRRRVGRIKRRRPPGLGCARRGDPDPLVTGRICDGGRRRTVVDGGLIWRSWRRVRRILVLYPAGLAVAQEDGPDPLFIGRNCDGHRRRTVAGGVRKPAAVAAVHGEVSSESGLSWVLRRRNFRSLRFNVKQQMEEGNAKII
ncbi:hypothetical protein VIGAN_04276600 [Vigna angularis var. angularis]|uniref:Uncharacterized protein n=1 Tax=Vigna angularis var. angularis TaxID=157739 RepID=A0A0S3RXB6_PHAAN|nr:hypothetical protein VIGAN_04276600 [Vigna angularis var. angularis]